MAFFQALGLQETRRKESEKGKFTLVFMASAPGAPEIELTHNWGGEKFAPPVARWDTSRTPRMTSTSSARTCRRRASSSTARPATVRWRS